MLRLRRIARQSQGFEGQKGLNQQRTRPPNNKGTRGFSNAPLPRLRSTRSVYCSVSDARFDQKTGLWIVPHV